MIQTLIIAAYLVISVLACAWIDWIAYKYRWPQESRHGTLDCMLGFIWPVSIPGVLLKILYDRRKRLGEDL